MSEQRHEMDAGWPFFVAAAVETPIQAVLHAALAYVHRHGVCEFTDETDALVERLSVCGFAVQDEAPSLIVRAAAERVLEELARGSGCEDDPAEIYYPDLLAAIMLTLAISATRTFAALSKRPIGEFPGGAQPVRRTSHLLR